MNYPPFLYSGSLVGHDWLGAIMENEVFSLGISQLTIVNVQSHILRKVFTTSFLPNILAAFEVPAHWIQICSFKIYVLSIYPRVIFHCLDDWYNSVSIWYSDWMRMRQNGSYSNPIFSQHRSKTGNAENAVIQRCQSEMF